MSTLVLLTSKKHTTESLEKSFREFCRSTVLTAVSYWWSSHCISAEKFVTVDVVKSQPFIVGVALQQGCVVCSSWAT